MLPNSPILCFTDRYRPNRHGGLVGGLLICLILVAIVGVFGYRFYQDEANKIDQASLITQVATRGSFDHIVLEQGEIESSSNTEVICEVKSRAGNGGTAILWVIDEGARVSKGEKLVELDSSQLETQMKEQKIQVITAEARLTTAAALVEQAKISRQEYLEGVFKTEEKAILSEKAIAEQNLRKAKLAIQSSERLVAKGLVKSLQLEADRFAVANAQNQLDAAIGRLSVLRNLTQKKMLVQFDSDIEAAEATLSAATSELREEQNELDEIEEQITKCVMFAPSDGVVVHANRYSQRGGGAEFVVEAGAVVRERQAIIRLPDPSLMQVNCKINESRITLIEKGMPAKIRIDAIPGLSLTGRVAKVNRYAEPGGFFSSSIKEYATLVEIIDPPDHIRTGMTAEIQIFVEQLDDALQIPIQGLYEHGGEMYTLIQRGSQIFETAKVDIRATNDTMASINSGLEENDKIVLNLRDHLSLMQLPDVIKEDNSEFRKMARDRAEAVQSAIAASPNAPEAAQVSNPNGPSGQRGGPGEGPNPSGRPGRGDTGPGAGGMPDVNTIVTRSMERNDTNGDGELSADEINAIDGQYRSRIADADTNGDGNVSRSELLESMKKRIGQAGGSG